jgi:hypothetical protein
MNIPNVDDIVKSWAIPMKAVILQRTMKDGILEIVKKPINFTGVPLQPITEQKLLLKPEGERAWRYYTLYCTYNFKVGDCILLNKKEYEIREKNDWNAQGHYKFYKYDLIENYENQPTTNIN